MKSAFAHLLTVSALFAGYHITVQHNNDSTSMPVFNTGKLYFENGALQSSKGGIDIPIEEIRRITFPIKDIDPLVQSSEIIQNDSYIKTTGDKISLNFSTMNKDAQKATLFLVNLQGRVLVKREIALKALTADIDLSDFHLASGVYTLVCTVAQRTVVEKLILK